MSQSQSQTSTNVQNSFPKKEQAIIMNVVADLKLRDYLLALGHIVEPKNIIFASRISNGRICVYLATVELVDKIVSEHATITVNNVNLDIRRLITPAKRIIISNVCPSIPHEVIENVIQTMGFKIVSPINFLRTGIPTQNFNMF